MSFPEVQPRAPAVYNTIANLIVVSAASLGKEGNQTHAAQIESVTENRIAEFSTSKDAACAANFHWRHNFFVLELQLPEQTASKLQEAAERLSVSPEQLSILSIEEKLAQLEDEFRRSAE